MDEDRQQLIRRLQAFAQRLGAGAPAEGLLRDVAAALSRWETALGRGAGARTGGDERSAAPADPAQGTIRIWCDGSCAPNPGPGGWAAIIEQGGERRTLSGASAASTNNIMELTAAIEALRETPPGARVHVATDSRYLADGITRWVPGWKRRGWRKADGHPVLNQPLWETLDALIRERHVTWEWVAGHSGHPENEHADRLANQARENQALAR